MQNFHTPMKPIIQSLPVLLLAILFGGCDRKKTCQMVYAQVPAQVGLVGFSAAEADTVVVLKYAADGRFAQALDSQLIAVPRPDSMQGDTLRLVYGNGLIELRIGGDYIIRIPGAPREYRITGLGTNDADYSFEANDCPHGSVSYTAPGYAQVNQAASRPISEPHEPAMIPLHRFLLRK